jgi:uncharacterized protein YdhG (YjbR/CyaY superfamily)
MAKMIIPKNPDAYIASFPSSVQSRMQSLRKTIKTAAPNAEEVISYGMIGYKYYGMLVFFAAWQTHIGFYPAGRLEVFTKELAGYKRSKGTIQFPLDKPLPLRLISRIVKFRVKENELKYAAKKKK